MQKKKKKPLTETNKCFWNLRGVHAGQLRKHPQTSLLGTIFSSAPHIKFHPSVHFGEIETILRCGRAPHVRK